MFVLHGPIFWIENKWYPGIIPDTLANKLDELILVQEAKLCIQPWIIPPIGHRYHLKHLFIFSHSQRKAIEPRIMSPWHFWESIKYFLSWSLSNKKSGNDAWSDSICISSWNGCALNRSRECSPRNVNITWPGRRPRTSSSSDTVESRYPTPSQWPVWSEVLDILINFAYIACRAPQRASISSRKCSRSHPIALCKKNTLRQYT